MPRSQLGRAITAAPLALPILFAFAGCNILLDIGGPDDYQIVAQSSSSSTGSTGAGGMDAGSGGPRIECAAIKAFGDDASQLSIDRVSADFDGNIYLAASFANQISLGGDLVVSNGAQDALIIKLNSATLEPLWSQHYGSASKEAGTVVLATQDTVYFGGAYEGNSIAFDGLTTTDPDPGDGVEDAFMVALSPVGTALWASYCGSDSNTYQHRCIDFDTDPLKNILSTQSGDGMKSFSTVQFLPDGTDPDKFYSTRSQTTGIWGGAAIIENTLIRAGEYNQDIDWDSSGTCYSTQTSGQALNIFMQARKINCIDCTANCSDHIWQKAAGDVQSQHFGDIAADDGAQSGQKGAVLTGYFDGTLNFGNTPLASKGLSDIFIMKVDPITGSELWAKSFGDDRAQQSKAITLKNDRIYMSGDYWGTIDFSAEPISADEQDVFVALLDSGTGNPLAAASFGGPGSQVLKDMDVDPERNIILIGTFEKSIDFGCPGGPLTNTGTSPQHFVAKLKVSGI